MAGEILAKLGVRAGAPVTQDMLEEAKKVWTELYLFFMLIMSHNPIKRQQLEDMKVKLAEANELISSLEI